MSARVLVGVLTGMRALWLGWSALWVLVVGYELVVGVPLHSALLVTLAFLALPFALVAHELGHALAAVSVGARGLRLSRQGWSLEVSCVCGNVKDDAVVAFGGPLASACGAALLGGVEYVTRSGLLVAPTLIFLVGAASIMPWARDGRTFWTWAWSLHVTRRA